MNQEETLTFDESELEMIREFITQISCAYERKTFFYNCCDANEAIDKIHDFLENQYKFEDRIR